MLSEDINALGARLSEYSHTGMRVEAEGVVILVQTIRDLAAQARSLEAAEIAPSARMVDMPDNVVRLANILHRQGVRVGPRPLDGGAA